MKAISRMLRKLKSVLFDDNRTRVQIIFGYSVPHRHRRLFVSGVITAEMTKDPLLIDKLITKSFEHSTLDVWMRRQLLAVLKEEQKEVNRLLDGVIRIEPLQEFLLTKLDSKTYPYDISIIGIEINYNPHTPTRPRIIKHSTCHPVKATS